MKPAYAAYARDEAAIVDSTQNIVDAAGGVGACLVHLSTDAVSVPVVQSTCTGIEVGERR